MFSYKDYFVRYSMCGILISLKLTQYRNDRIETYNCSSQMHGFEATYVILLLVHYITVCSIEWIILFTNVTYQIILMIHSMSFNRIMRHSKVS